MDYAVIRVGNKQHRVRDGETLVVDRVRTEEGETFTPDVLLASDGLKVTVTVVAHERGPKIRIGKYRRRTGYRRHTGFRAATSRIEVSFGGGKASSRKADARRKAAEPLEATEQAEPASKSEAARVVEWTPGKLPEGYDELTVAAITKAAKTWDRAELEAALDYERAHAARKGAVSALESALAKDDDGEGGD
jgi:large subunit ribosomal protein L21